METNEKKPRVVRVRSCEFQYGLLHMKAAEVKHTTDAEVADKFGSGKGPLLEAWDDEMPLKQFNALDEFTEQ